ncbi:hypothetical protein BK130_03640 [Viridibacillus sp. FSL H8-0123]|nr:hypothetical protein BK128_19855 [Viridibacillus sp. FSL H7-0596]OMC84963.1 hypothetical protein BK130_03640 [Viridibacillus sp. FSL H8-0123]OMC92008.1 hypothetical protein BK137_07575 [Viridibacillus arenosi]
MNKRVRVMISLISCLILCVFGVYSLITASASVIPAVLFTIGGFIGFIDGIYEIKNFYIA